MKAKLTKQVSNARQPDNKEMVDCYNVISYKAGAFKEIITARFYMGRSNRASVVYCCVWVSGKDFYTSGKGNAGGYGYHKLSQALQEALDSAGVELYGNAYGKDDRKSLKKRCHIGGVGETAMSAAFHAIAKALGYNKIHITHN